MTQGSEYATPAEARSASKPKSRRTARNPRLSSTGVESQNLAISCAIARLLASAAEAPDEVLIMAVRALASQLQCPAASAGPAAGSEP